MKKVIFTAALLLFGPVVYQSAPLAHAGPYDVCQYQLGDKVVSIACGSDPLAEPGIAGNLPGSAGRDPGLPQPTTPGLPPGYSEADGWYPGCTTVPMC